MAGSSGSFAVRSHTAARGCSAGGDPGLCPRDRPAGPFGGGVAGLPLGLLVQLVSPTVGQELITRYAALVSRAFEPAMLPTILPRLALFTLIVIVLIVAGAALRERLGRGDRRRDRGPWWGWALGAPWNAREPAELFREALWKFLRGAAAVRQPSAPEFSRRYAELLGDNLGQPGFAELMVVAHDLDARHDVVFALLAEPFRQKFQRAGSSGHRRRSGELIDLSGTGRQQVLDALAAALSLPVLSEAHTVTFPLEGFWQGETHRLSDRLGLIARVLDEVAAAGVRQVLLVSAAAERAVPHRLVSRSLTLRSRVAELSPALTARIRAYIDEVDPAVSGQGGSNPTFRLANVLVWGFALSINRARPFMHNYSASKCSPRWSAAEIEHKLEDALVGEHEKPRGYLLGEDNVPWPDPQPLRGSCAR